MKKVIALSIIIALICSAAVFAKGASQSGGTERHVMVSKSTGNPYFERMFAGFKEAVESQGFEAIHRAPDLPTAEAQIQIIDQLIAQRVNSICIAANDFDALQPALQRAMNAGIKVTSADSAVNPASRMTHINQAGIQAIGETLVEAAYDLAGGSGDIAILSATSQASNQNAWIAVMQDTLKQAKYSKLNLVRIAYGDDLRDKSTSETQGLLASFPNLKVIIAPTTVGVAAAAKVVTDQGLIGKVLVTGLGLPSEMADYINNKACPYMFLWNPSDLGYVSAFAGMALSSGKITGKVGDSFTAGKLGTYKVTPAADGGTEVLLGPPFKFDPSNINDWKNVY